MANVNQINETTQPMTGQTQNKTRVREGSEAFDALLNHALDQKESPGSVSGVSGLQELDAVRLEPATPSAIVYGKTDELLGLMDNYAAQLGNTDISLKAIAPVLEQMNADADDLIKETRFLGNQDSGLKEIATRTAIAAQTEYVKFQRGDYLS